MTVAGNMAFPLKMTKLTRGQKAELKKRVDEKYTHVNIIKDNRPHKYAGAFLLRNEIK